ncbi:hypothetical protein EYF80_008288 [Liparis tanakae]|uniref:Uncharacterized protein n=1 Tax=Liparis tanakae TaxID=230148 RepID=A0A4Z2IUJ4_9TELE|nr:hypothetical protein EYF80_008288 [Liparis tanakae]
MGSCSCRTVDVSVAVGRAAALYVSLQPVHIDGTVLLIPVLSLVVGGVSVFLLLLLRPDAFLQPHQAGHIWGAVVLPAARWRLVAAILLVLVGHHLLDADHGLSFTDQRHLGHAVVTEEKKRNQNDGLTCSPSFTKSFLQI